MSYGRERWPVRGRMGQRLVVILWCMVLVLAIAPTTANAQEPGDAPVSETILEAEVGFVRQEGQVEEYDGQPQFYQQLDVIIRSGPRRGEVVVVENGPLPEVNAQHYRPGDRLFLRENLDPAASTAYVIEGRSRWRSLVLVILVFVGAVVLVARWRSLPSLLGLALSFAVLLYFILPRLAAGANPLFTILVGSILIVPASFYLAHGLSAKTSVAIVGTAISLVLTLVLAQLFVRSTGLTGYASEEAAFLQTQSSQTLSIRDLLIAGIIVGVLGVLDDVTIAQASTVQELQRANAELGTWELFQRAMRVGRDHIASVVNTLVLVYAGASLPLLLLLRTSPLPLTYMVSQEIIAEEVVRTMVASIGLLIAVPITTWLAAVVVVRLQAKTSSGSQQAPGEHNVLGKEMPGTGKDRPNPGTPDI